MIDNVTIKNFAIINEMTIDFHPGLTVMTGETGSGKSVILQAINTLVQGNSRKSILKSGATQAVVDLDFNKNFYRKIITEKGRSRSYVNEIPKSLSNFNKEFYNKIEFHGQNDQQLILKSENHIDYLDYFCGNQKDVTEIKKIYADIENAKKQLRDLEINMALFKEKKELLIFQLNEIKMADIKENEEAELYADYKKLNSKEQLINTLNNVKNSLNEYDSGVVLKLTNILSEIKKLVKYDKSIKNISDLINDIVLQLQEVEMDIEGRLTNDDFDKSRLPIIEERIGVIETLKRKYGGSTESIFENEKLIKKQIDELSAYVQSDSDLKSKIKDYENKYIKIANKLSSKRNEKVGILSSKIEKSLALLNMEHARFEIQISNISDDSSFMNNEDGPIKIFPNGIEQVEFFLSANPGEPIKPMASIASGGEMSRIMLAIKTVFQDKNPVSTLIFDEIDTGISGETAKKVSNHLKKLSKYKQVICITHLPQIAVNADNHLHITKSVINSNSTSVKAEYLYGDISDRVINNLFVGKRVET